MSSLPLLPIVVAQGAAPLSPAQTRFNTLVRQIAQARDTLAAWQAGVSAFRAAHARHIAPLEAELDRVRRQRVVLLDALSHRSGLARIDLDTLSGLIAREAYALLTETPDDRALAALYAQHAGADFASAQRARGDPDHAASDSETEPAPREIGRDAATDGDGPSGDDDWQRHAPPPRPARRSAAQRKRDAEARQALQSVRDVYRKLASALHPDREPDAAKHAAKTALMQQVNHAYADNDLLALLELQLQIEQVDLKGLASADTRRLKLYNAVFADQLASLKAAARDMETDFCRAFGLRQDLMLNPRKLDPLVRALRTEMQAWIRASTLDRRQLADPDWVKRWLKHERTRGR